MPDLKFKHMLNAKEKRFLRYWEEQRSGGKLPYFLMYISLGTIIASLMIFVVLLFFLQVGLEPFMLWLVPVCGFITAIILSLAGWWMNERKWRLIIRREVVSGMEREEKEDDTAPI